VEPDEKTPQTQSLTPREKQVWALFHDEGLPASEVGRRLGIAKGTVDRFLHSVRNKLEGKPYRAPRGEHGKSWSGVDKTRPEEWGKAVDALTGADIPNIVELARQAEITNITPDALRALQKRLDSGDLAPIQQAIQPIKNERLSAITAQKAERIINSITDADIDNAKLRDKAIASAVLIDKHLLLEGKPTSRIEISDTRQIGELMQRLVKVMQHRGMEVEINPAQPFDRPAIGPPRSRYDHHELPSNLDE